MKFGQWVGFIVFLVSLYVLWEVRQLLLLLFTAVVLATALNRGIIFLQRLGVKNRNAAFVCTILAALLIATIFGLLIVPPFVEQFQDLIAIIPKVWEEIRLNFTELEGRLPSNFPALPTLSEIIVQLQPLGTEVLTRFFSFFNSSITILLQLLLVIVLTLMLLANPQAYRRGLLRLFPSFYRRRADEILVETEISLANWLGGIVINCIFIGILSGVGLWILGVRFVLAHALLAGLLNFIPNIGPTMSVVFPMMVAVLDAPWKIIAVLIWYFIIQQIESYWLTPTVMAHQVSLLPAITLAAQIFFATAFGALGLLLALPLTVVAKNWIEEVLFKDILDGWDWQDRHKSVAVAGVEVAPSAAIAKPLPSVEDNETPERTGEE